MVQRDRAAHPQVLGVERDGEPVGRLSLFVERRLSRQAAAHRQPRVQYLRRGDGVHQIELERPPGPVVGSLAVLKTEPRTVSKSRVANENTEGVRESRAVRAVI